MTRASWKADADGIVRMGEGASRQQGNCLAVLKATCVPETTLAPVFLLSYDAVQGVAPGLSVQQGKVLAVRLQLAWSMQSSRVDLPDVDGELHLSALADTDVNAENATCWFYAPGSRNPGAFFIKGEGNDVRNLKK